jgi:ankyrin repeat protein
MAIYKTLIAALILLSGAVKPVRSADIHEAANKGDIDKVKSILGEKPELVNTKDDQSYTALHIAAYLGHKEVVEVLIANGGDVSLEDKDGRSPLHCAVCHEHKPATEVLISNKADVNAKDKNSRTALHFAASGGQHDIAELLIAKGAEVNAGNKEGQTPLYLATYNGHKKVVKVLIDNGADVNSKSKDGLTPLRMAIEKGYIAITNLLQRHGAKLSYETTPTVVGPLGDTTNLSFEGNKTFTARNIRDGLVTNPDFLLASHPSAPFAKYLEVVQEHVRTGYEHNGFPQVQVTTRFDKDSEKIVVIIQEGNRYKCGPVRVLGAKTLPVGSFINRLTQPWPLPESVTKPPQFPGERDKDGLFVDSTESFRHIDNTGQPVRPEKPIWETGEPAAFSEAHLKFLNKNVRKVLSEFGYFFPALEVKIVPEPNKESAELLVEILDEGPKGTIGEIEIAGNNKNTREQILKYLGLEVGMEFNRSLITKTEYLLWRSGRFLNYKVSPDVINPREPKLKLHIDLNEYEAAPPLFKELLPVEKTLLKLQEHLSNLPYGQEDAAISFHSKEFGTLLRMIVSPQKGILLVAENTDPNGKQVIPGAALLAKEKPALFSPGRQRKLICPAPAGQMEVSMSILPNPNPKEGTLFVLLPGIAFHSEESDQPYRLTIKLAPVAFIYMAYKDEMSYSPGKEVLTITGKKHQLKVDAESGKLIELVISMAGQKEVRLVIEKDAFDQTMKRIEETTAECPNAFNPKEPLSSTVKYLAEEQILHRLLRMSSLCEKATPEQLARAAKVFAKILEKQPLAPLEALFFKSRDESGESFKSPPDYSENMEAATDKLIPLISAVVFRYCNNLFPQRSWPWTVAREAVFVTSGKDAYTMAELKRIYESKETGPIGCLTTSKLLSLVKSPLAKAFADRGLERLSADDFRSDWRLAFEGESVLAQCLVRTAEAFSDLTDEDIDALVAVLPPEHTAFIRDSARLLREGKDKSLGEVLRPAMDEYWEKTLKKKIEAALKKLTISKQRRADALDRDRQTDLLHRHYAANNN